VRNGGNLIRAYIELTLQKFILNHSMMSSDPRPNCAERSEDRMTHLLNERSLIVQDTLHLESSTVVRSSAQYLSFPAYRCW